VDIFELGKVLAYHLSSTSKPMDENQVKKRKQEKIKRRKEQRRDIPVEQPFQ